MMFYDPCYPSLFLCGWDHYYLDTIGKTNKPSLDIKEQIDKSSLVDTKYVICMYIFILLNPRERPLIYLLRYTASQIL